MAPRNPAEPIGKILPKLLERFRPDISAGMLEVWRVWDSAAGEELARHARPVAFKGSTLLVAVASSSWRHHLHFLKADLVRRLNAELGRDMVTDIKFKVGSL